MADFDELELLSPEDLLLAQISVARAQGHEVELKLEMTLVRRRMTWLAACALLGAAAVAVAVFVVPFVPPQLRELAPAILTFCAIGLYAVAITYVQQESQRRFFGHLLQRLTEALGDANDAMERALTLSESQGDYA